MTDRAKVELATVVISRTGVLHIVYAGFWVWADPAHEYPKTICGRDARKWREVTAEDAQKIKAREERYRERREEWESHGLSGGFKQVGRVSYATNKRGEVHPGFGPNYICYRCDMDYHGFCHIIPATLRELGKEEA